MEKFFFTLAAKENKKILLSYVCFFYAFALIFFFLISGCVAHYTVSSRVRGNTLYIILKSFISGCPWSHRVPDTNLSNSCCCINTAFLHHFHHQNLDYHSCRTSKGEACSAHYFFILLYSSNFSCLLRHLNLVTSEHNRDLVISHFPIFDPLILLKL